ncbi:MAG: non-ribosomal peptide synthetase, partial [Verrucomicrobiota bacterium]
GLKYLLAGGDVLSTTHVFKAVEQLKGCKLINGYGPTENTTFTCCYSVPENWKPVRSVPIGHPISNSQVYILDPYLQPTPIGVPGELYLGGYGLARSYVNRPELTAAKFLPSPFKKNERLYKTGDKVRYLHDGTIEFLGRLDNQVKIRGFRIELEEIETALNEHPLIRQATVIARQDSRTEKYLAAYLLPEAADPIESEVRAYLEQKLPGYMVPQYFVLLREFPLNPNGKVDRNKLPAPNDSFFNPDRVLVPPRNDVEKTLFSIWREVLGRDQFGVHDNFFELGGHSLLATQVVSRMAKNFNVEFPLSRIFERPTIASLAIAVTENSQAVSKPQPQLVRRKQPDGKNAVEKSTLVQT